LASLLDDPFWLQDPSYSSDPHRSPFRFSHKDVVPSKSSGRGLFLPDVLSALFLAFFLKRVVFGNFLLAMLPKPQDRQTTIIL
jgi:hypothetical protein